MLVRGLRATPLRIPGFAGWVVGAELSGPGWAPARPLRVFSIHCPVGERGYIRTLHQILDRIARLASGADLLLGGDFNVVVGHRQPNERIRMSRGEREILDRLSAEFGLISCWQAAHPGARARADPSMVRRPRGALPLRRHLRAAAWSARLVSCRVVTGSRWAALSDHNPVLAEFTR